MKEEMDLVIGDTVRVIDSAQTYSNYTEMFIKLGFADCSGNKHSIANGELCRVFATATHPNAKAKKMVALRSINNPDKESLMNAIGVELVNGTHTKTISLKDLKMLIQ